MLPQNKDQLSSHGIRKVCLRYDSPDIVDDGVNGRLKEYFEHVPEGRDWNELAVHEGNAANPGTLSIPPLTPRPGSLSLGVPNFTESGFLASEKIVFAPVSKLFVNASKTCFFLQKVEFLSLPKAGR